MPLNSAAMVYAANALKTGALLYGQLHSADAGASYTSNVITVVGRKAVSWATPTALGNLVLLTKISWTGGTVGTPVFSLTLWDNITIGSGTCYGQFISASDRLFDSSGNYDWTMLDLTGAAS